MTRLGSYSLDSIITGDARLLAPSLPDSSIDLILTDPPFGIGFRYSSGYDDDPESYPALVRWLVSECDRLLKPGSLCFVYQAMKRLRETWQLFPSRSRIFAGVKNFTQFRPTPVQYSWDPIVFWAKEGQSSIKPIAGRRDWHVGNTAYYVTLDSFHDCPRPLNTIEYLVENFSLPSDVVLDFFMGSGTTAVAAKKLSRHWIGFEIMPEVARLARERIAKEPDPLPLHAIYTTLNQLSLDIGDAT